MEQILVMKSKRKDVLVKNVGGGPTLFQSPGDKTPKFMDLWNAARHGKGTSGNPVGVGGRIAGGLGLAGKGLAVLQTANQVAQQAQAGNPLGAALGAGYAYEANDPTGKRTATAIQGQAPPTPSVEEQRANVPQIPLPGQVPVRHGLDLQPSGPQNVAPAPATTTRTGPPPVVAGPTGPPPAPPVAVGPTGSAAAARAKFNEEFPPVSLEPQPVQQMAQPLAPVQQSTVQTTFNPFPQAPGQENISMLQGNGTPVVAPGQENLHMLDPMASFSQGQEERYNLDPSDPRYLAPGQTTAAMRFANDSKLASAEFFASTLMEKLGADTVYKMNPHQIAMVSAYTFLKLS